MSIIYDISKTISENMVVYKNRDSKRIKRNWVSVHSDSGMQESELTINMHTGSHIDAPLHMIDGGDTIEYMELDRYIGRCKVYDLTCVSEAIHKSDIDNFNIYSGDRVLFKTVNSYDKEYNPKFVYIEEDAAIYLRDIGIALIGVDAMSLERDKPNHDTHKIILGSGIAVIEDLDLSRVESGEYELIALPIRIEGAEASWTRAVLRTVE